MSVTERAANWQLTGLMSSTSLYGWVAPTSMPRHRPGQVHRHHKCPPNYKPSETDERLLRVDPKWCAWSWIGRPGRSAGSGSDGPNTCSWSSNCCANCSSNLCKYLSKQKIQILDQSKWICKSAWKYRVPTHILNKLKMFVDLCCLWIVCTQSCSHYYNLFI